LFFSTLHYYSQQIIQIIFLTSEIASLFYYPRVNRKITIFSLSSFTILNSFILTLFFSRSKHTLSLLKHLLQLPLCSSFFTPSFVVAKYISKKNLLYQKNGEMVFFFSIEISFSHVSTWPSTLLVSSNY
jgi:hypothetical protein